MKKLLHIQVSPKMSGVQQVSFDILRSLNKYYDCYIIFSSPIEPGFREKFENEGISVYEMKYLSREVSLKDIKSFFEFYCFFRKNHFDIVHTNSTKPGITARIAAKLSGVNSVVHSIHGIAFHAQNSKVKNTVYYIIEFFSSLFGDYIVSVNNYYLKYYPDILGKKKVIHNGVDFSLFEPINKLERKNGDICIAFFARLDEQKSPLNFIRIVDLLVNEFNVCDSIEFSLAGDGILLDECKALIDELNLNDRLKLVGWVTDKKKYLESVDILVQPSLWEAFGLNIVESAYFSIPCVASNVEGIPEVIINNETGFLCDPHNLYDFAEKINLLINDTSLRLAMGKKAKQFVTDSFSLDKMVKKYIELYKELS